MKAKKGQLQPFSPPQEHRCVRLSMSTGTPNIGPAFVLPPPHSGHGRREIVGNRTTCHILPVLRPNRWQAWRHHVTPGVAGIWVIQDRANQVPYHGPYQEPIK